MKEDLISIIVPVYNVEEYLDKCVESIVSQTYQNLEILLIDDGSTDSSGQKCDEWAKKDGRIKVIHKENEGVSKARNVGLEVAIGKYIGFVDSDDYINQQMYEIMYKEMKNNDVELVMCNYKRVKDNEIKDNEIKEYSTEIFNKSMMLEKFYPYFGVIWLSLYVKEKLKNIKFDVNRYVGEDLKFTCDYIVRCEKGLYIKSDLYYYRLRNESVTQTNNSKEKRLQYYIDSIDAVKNAEMIILENCSEADIIRNTRKLAIDAYWTYIYVIIGDKLKINRELKKKYCKELKEHKKYFSVKDKIYIVIFGINSKLFGIICRLNKKIKNIF